MRYAKCHTTNFDNVYSVNMITPYYLRLLIVGKFIHESSGTPSSMVFMTCFMQIGQWKSKLN